MGRTNSLVLSLVRALAATLWLMFGCVPAAAGAEAFPSKAVRIVLPYPISGPTDIRGTYRMSRSYRLIASQSPPAISEAMARTVAEAIRAGTGAAVMIERQPGAATTRGAITVARAARDGYTLLIGSNATMVINPHYFRDLEYDPERDFELVAPLASMPFVLLARASVPADTPQALVAWLKPRPDEINYGSSGGGSTAHLAGELFRRMTGVRMVHVSYSGGVPALTGLAQGQVSLMFAALPLALAHIPNDHFKPLAVTTARRLRRLPGLPTLAESGWPEFDLEGWYGLFAPAGSPRAAIAGMRQALLPFLSEPATQAHFSTLGLEPVAMSLERFATRIHTEQARWATVLRAHRIPFRGEGGWTRDEG